VAKKKFQADNGSAVCGRRGSPWRLISFLAPVSGDLKGQAGGHGGFFFSRGLHRLLGQAKGRIFTTAAQGGRGVRRIPRASAVCEFGPWTMPSRWPIGIGNGTENLRVIGCCGPSCAAATLKTPSTARGSDCGDSARNTGECLILGQNRPKKKRKAACKYCL